MKITQSNLTEYTVPKNNLNFRIKTELSRGASGCNELSGVWAHTRKYTVRTYLAQNAELNGFYAQIQSIFGTVWPSNGSSVLIKEPCMGTKPLRSL